MPAEPGRPLSGGTAVSRPLQRRGDSLYLEDVPIARLAEEYDTPLYAYSRSALRDRARVLRSRPSGDAVPPPGRASHATGCTTV